MTRYCGLHWKINTVTCYGLTLMWCAVSPDCSTATREGPADDQRCHSQCCSDWSKSYYGYAHSASTSRSGKHACPELGDRPNYLPREVLQRSRRGTLLRFLQTSWEEFPFSQCVDWSPIPSDAISTERKDRVSPYADEIEAGKHNR